MKSLIFLICVFGVAYSAPYNETRDNPLASCLTNPCVVVDGVGKIMGTKKESEFTNKNIYSYFSIPYGKPTGGSKRFAPPEMADRINDAGTFERFDGTYLTYLTGVLNNLCPQAGVSLKESFPVAFTKAAATAGGMTDEEKEIMAKNAEELETRAMAGSEDCLTLAVHTPYSPNQLESGDYQSLPVMFFIHGGAFYMGGYIGHGPKVLLENQVILVEVQYRLGILGFMCLDHPEAAGNMGLMDQSLALEWVKMHVADFGGNPDEITVFGESAGAASASYHMLSPMSSRNFNKVIAQSGSALAGWAFDLEPEFHAKQIAQRAGCPTESLDGMVQCMKTMDAATVVDAHTAYISDERYQGRMGFGGSSPCAQKQGEKVFIDEHPESILQYGKFDPKPVVFGANKHEGSYVLGVIYNKYIEPRGLMHNASFLTHDFLPVMLNALGLDDKSGVIYEVVEHDYFNITDLGDWDKMMPGMINVVGTFFIKAATHEFMKYNSIHGGKSYFYSFEYEGENSIFNLLFGLSGSQPPLPHGVTHADDLIYVFSTDLFTRKGNDEEICKDFSHLWTTFATTGEFVTRRNVHVPEWNEHNPQYLKLDGNDNSIVDYVSTWNDPDRVSVCHK